MCICIHSFHLLIYDVLYIYGLQVLDPSSRFRRSEPKARERHRPASFASSGSWLSFLYTYIYTTHTFVSIRDERAAPFCLGSPFFFKFDLFCVSSLILACTIMASKFLYFVLCVLFIHSISFMLKTKDSRFFHS